jgi:hypothetical protein
MSGGRGRGRDGVQGSRIIEQGENNGQSWSWIGGNCTRTSTTLSSRLYLFSSAGNTGSERSKCHIVGSNCWYLNCAHPSQSERPSYHSSCWISGCNRAHATSFLALSRPDACTTKIVTLPKPYIHADGIAKPHWPALFLLLSVPTLFLLLSVNHIPRHQDLASRR